MAGGKLSARQKMINMMYLVLTALLALNVSKEILDSFVTVNTGLETTKGTLQEKMDATYQQFGALASENQSKYGAAYAQAQEVQKTASGLITYIDSLKVKVISKAEGLPPEKVIGKDAAGKDTVLNLQHVSKKDSQDEITNLMVGGEPAKPKDGEWSATELRTKLEAYRDQLKSLRPGDEKFAANMDMLFNFEDRRDASGTMNNWQSINFYHVPLAAGITILSKIQGDIRNGENELVNHLLGSVEQKSFKFNTLAAIVKPRSSYVSVGGKYQAEIFLGAYDNQNSPDVYICGPGATLDTSSVPPKIVGEAIKLPMEGAKAILEQSATAAGLRSVKGIIEFTPVGGEKQIQPFETTYEVAQPNLVVSPTKMNVFYRGVDNPVSISVSGYSDKDIRPSIDGGHGLSKSGSEWVVKPGKATEAAISATVTNPDGSTKTMKGMTFRVKNVPNPAPYFAGKSVNDETIKKAELTASQGVIAKMENFEFDLKFDVVEFRVTMIVGGTPIEKYTKGPALSGEMKEMLSKAKPGQKVYIENIKARGPDGTVRSLGSLSFKVT